MVPCVARFLQCSPKERFRVVLPVTSLPGKIQCHKSRKMRSEGAGPSLTWNAHWIIVLFELTEKLAPERGLTHHSPLSKHSKLSVLQDPLSRVGWPPKICDRKEQQNNSSHNSSKESRSYHCSPTVETFPLWEREASDSFMGNPAMERKLVRTLQLTASVSLVCFHWTLKPWAWCYLSNVCSFT